MEDLETKLEELLDEEFEAYLDECDLDEDRWIDSDDFAKVAKDNIENENGKDKFADFNIESYAREFASARSESLIERACEYAHEIYE